VKSAKDILFQYWGYDSFRPLQEQIVASILEGNDTLAILPTGGGKSLCFQVPGMALDGVVLVVTPLISLMSDQVQKLKSIGIKAEMLTSSMSYRDIDITIDNVRFGDTKFLYISPERIQSPLFKERLKKMQLSLLVVDEAHCISEWGHDFRPAYTKISDIREVHQELPIIALTASATAQVKEDIKQKLNLKSVKKFEGELQRTNIAYRFKESENKFRILTSMCSKRVGESGIIYCNTRRRVKETAAHLRANGIKAGLYHGGLSYSDRSYMMEEWMVGNLDVMVATNAFGMGMDKSDVRYVLHHTIPPNLESFYQESGRAGRDGKSSISVSIWNQDDIAELQNNIQRKYPEAGTIKLIYNGIMNFLKVAVGSGEGESYSFDNKKFCQTFDFKLYDVHQSLKILEQNGDLVFSQDSFFPTRIKFVVGSSNLYKFQVSNEKFGSLITFLSRTYPGIFDRFISIDESKIGDKLKLSSKQLRQLLEELEMFGILEASFQSSLPSIALIRERKSNDNLKISNEILANKKTLETRKLNAVIELLQTTGCRSRSITKYFDNDQDDCGNCDNCLAKDKPILSKDQALDKIMKELPSTLDELTNVFDGNKQVVKNLLHSLLLEGEITHDKGLYKRVSS
jgi:ATP-dependent DNA helicase RecQ